MFKVDSSLIEVFDWHKESRSPHSYIDGSYNFGVLKDKVLDKITFNSEFPDEIYFKCSNGNIFIMYHSQECCESVEIEDICGDLNSIIGSPLLMAEEVVSNIEGSGGTWTFYKLATINGYVTIRWLGSSNGYYSETVDFAKLK